MIQGIALFGENGSGKSTLAHMLAAQHGFFEMDAEDYYFPSQKASRICALEKLPYLSDPSAPLPFSQPCSAEAVQAALLADVLAHPRFVISAVTPKWCDEILSRLDIAFWLQTPLHTRLERIRRREENRFGARVLPGGDMYEQQLAFRELVQSRDPEIIRMYASRLPCPVIRLDGTKSAAANVCKIIERIKEH